MQAPTRAGDAPPGIYMLFVLDDPGVPSVAKIVRVNVADSPNPAIDADAHQPGRPDGTRRQRGDACTIAASDPNGDVLTLLAPPACRRAWRSTAPPA